ncbi:protein involved in gliding motility GldF [Paludibacter propionicigenes WB4]|uniref:Protein involved in gliding motility GldF n=1 Tax=Paludibacter propionicigenes (strain DSM 17365 / JCM 13257 / WB4) TaxID=694427 RepID=E4T8P5_PALPW|nr:gliding motility-associated ABC transporter permease subunit GldF [Paludibacter propionicigenes]ADQ81154.1 protein involved in gliding motility GldF [Paludibacter propionicigenes WB4]
MFSIFKKELRAFFSNATGYIVIGIFLILSGLFLWVIPGEYNILDSGYANVDGLFYLAPWLFLFLCPAVTMRLFAEEKQSGTWEFLTTKPISKLHLTLGKYFAGWVLVTLALLPTLLYYFTVSHIAEPVGNIDSGAFWGSFIGLLFLAAIYVSIGLFSSSVSNNQIVSFVVAVVLSFFFYYGFEVITSFFTSGESIQIIENLGIHSHYKSMSRGVIDSRDVLYFLLVCTGFISATVWKIKKK